MRPVPSLLKLGHLEDPITVTRLIINHIHRNPSPDSLNLCHHLFDHVSYKDTHLWTAMISLYSQSDRPCQSLRLLSAMHRLHNPPPNPHSLSAAARAVASLSDLRFAQMIHLAVMARGYLSNVVVGTSVVDMYSKCGEVGNAWEVFDEMPERNSVTWNSMVSGYVALGMCEVAVGVFEKMRCVSSEMVDGFTLASLLSACAAGGNLWLGMQFHGLVVKAGFGEDMVVGIATGNMYFRCGDVGAAERSMEDRCDVFSELVAVKGYAFSGRFEDVVLRISRNGCLLRLVMEDHGVVISVLSTCANLSLLRIARQVHSVIVVFGWLRRMSSDDRDVAIGGALIDMYFRCSCAGEARAVFDGLVEKNVPHWNSMVMGSVNEGLIGEARRFFDEMPLRNGLSWMMMILGYRRNGMARDGLKLVSAFYKGGCQADGSPHIMTAALDACSCMAVLNTGKELHARAIRTIADLESNSNVVLETALVDMYSKCGELGYARKQFDMMEDRNLVSWTSMLNGYATHGMASEAIAIFQEICQTGLKPNEVTFVALLSACAHHGLVEEGINYFKMMKERYNIVPRSDHYACLVDMLVRAGKLSEAWNLVEDSKDLKGRVEKCAFDTRDGSVILGSLVSGCGLQGDMAMVNKLAHKILESKYIASDTYITLSNAFASAQMWDEVHNIRRKWRRDYFPEGPGSSRVHTMISA